MTNSLPENEAPVTLRASKALSLPREQTQVVGSVAAGQRTPPPSLSASSSENGPVEGLLVTPAFGAGAVAVLLGAGWLLLRRQRLAHHAHRADQIAAPSPPPAAATVIPPEALEPLAAPERSDAPPTADVVANLATQSDEKPGLLQPRQTFPAPLEQHHRLNSRIGIASQKRLIKSLMWVRTLAGGAALVAAIAIVVFWSIETIDQRSGDTGLTRPLVLLVLIAWAASWGAGQLANQLHRMFFNRVHPKFDT